MSLTNDKIFKKAELANKKTILSIIKINKIIRAHANKLKYYKKLTNIHKLKIGYDITYIYLDKERYKLERGGKVVKINKKPNGDYIITFKDNFSNEWNILYSKIIIFYKNK